MKTNSEQCIMKSVSTIETKSIDKQARTIEFMGTSARQDRSGDIIETMGWEIENFMANPVFLWSHDGRSMPPIGRALAITRTAEGLKFKIEFAPKEIHPFADTIFKLYEAGFLRGVSVGFLPKQREIITDPQSGEFVGFRFLKQELIELSAVSVPDNPEALIQEAVDGVLHKEAAEFLSKSLYAENSFLNAVQDLKKEILLMNVNEQSTDHKEVEQEETTISIDKWRETVENRLKQLEEFAVEQKAFMGMQKSATEVFQAVKSLLDGMKQGSGNEHANPFLKVLAPGNAPEGKPEDSKALIDAIGKATQTLSKWTPAKKQD